MPANVTQMFSVREVPWHREGTVTQDYPQTWAAARTLAGLDWEPEEHNIRRELATDGELRIDIEHILADVTLGAQARADAIMTAINSAHPIEDTWQEVRHSGNGNALCMTPSTYQIIGHGPFGEIFEAVLNTDKDNLKVETGGVLDEGRAVWMLIRLDEPIKLRGLYASDKSASMPYLAITSRHDGKGGTILRATMVRIVCANTFRAAELEGERTKATFKFVHRGDWKLRIEDARAAVTGARREFQEYRELAEHLLSVKVTKTQTGLFLTEFLPAPPAGMASDRVLANVEASRATLRAIIESDTVNGAGVGGTAWGLVQAAGEYLDHARESRSWETRLNRTLLSPEPLKAKAMKLALAAAGS